MPIAQGPVSTSQLTTHRVDRRTVARGLAWTVPVIAVGAAMPYASASTQCALTTTGYSSTQQAVTATIPSGASAVTVVLTAASGGAGGSGRQSGVQSLSAPQAIGHTPPYDIDQVTLTITGTLTSDLTVTFRNASGGKNANGSQPGANGANGTGVNVSGMVNQQLFSAVLRAPGGLGGSGATSVQASGGNGGSSGSGTSTISSSALGAITSTMITPPRGFSDATVTISYCA